MANSAQQSIANALTPNDGTSYVDGVLTDDNTGQPVDDSNAVVGNDGSILTSNSSNNDDDNNVVSNVTNAVTNFATGFQNDAMMGYDKIMLSNEQFIEKYGQDVVDDFNRRTEITSLANNKPNLSLEEFTALGYTADEFNNYQNKVNFNESGQSGGGSTSGSGDDENPLQNAVDDFLEGSGTNTGPLSPDSILAMAEKAGLIKSNEDLAALVADPKGYLEARGATLSDIVPSLDPNTAGALLDPNNPNYLLKGNLSYTPSTVNQTQLSTAPTDGIVQGYDAATMGDRLNNPQFNVDAVTGQIKDQNLVDADSLQIDMTGAATGINADGTVNETGQALNDYAIQKFSDIIDTSTVSGKLLADQLGEGNYTDSKATLLGQMEIISGQFVDSNGNPKIPPWAQGVARNVSKTIAFKGMSGTAATAAMATAMMEASLGIAEKEAAFFQTLTLKNLDNRQKSIINKATVLSKFELGNLNARETAAVNNAQAFLKIDLANLTNEQQAEIINTQAKVQALFEDTSAENASRLFTAENQNDFTKFYDQLGVQVQQFNAEQVNLMKKFNAGEINDAAEFNAAMEDSRQKFYADMQFQIDTANAKWRQTVATTNTAMQFEAAAADVKAILDINQEGLNRTWDRTDALLDYIFKGSVAQEEFELKLLLGQMQAQAGASGGGSFVTDLIKIGVTKWLFSDVRLKEDIQFYEERNGIKFYTWKWNAEAKRVGADMHPSFGVIAQEVREIKPEAVEEGPYGYLVVDYRKLK